MFCRFCGKEIKDDSIFCPYCGKKLEYNDSEVIEEPKKEEKVVDEDLKKFKKDYSLGTLPALIWFGVLNVIGSTFLVIGYVIVCLIYINDIDINSINFQNIGAIVDDLASREYFVIVPIMYTIGYIIAGIIAYIVGKRIIYKKEENKEVHKKNIRKLSAFELILVILVAFGLWGAGVLIGNLPSFFFDEGSDTIKYIFGNYTYIYLLQAIIGAPIIEELIFRKFLIDKISHRGEGLACLISAMLFGLVHGNLGQFFLAFFLGMLFAIIYTKTRNILYTMLLHFMINTFASLTEIFGLFGLNIELVWNILAISLMVIGIIMMIIFRKNELFKVSRFCEYDGYLIHRAVVFEIFFILTLVTLASGTLSLSISKSLNTLERLLYIALELVPAGVFVAIMLLYNRQVHKVFIKNPNACSEVIDEEVIDNN